MLETASRSVTVRNAHGLHARPSHAVVSLATRFEARITLRRGERQADARSILAVMTLGAAHGDEVEITAQGVDAAAAVEELAELFEQGFQEIGK